MLVGNKNMKTGTNIQRRKLENCLIRHLKIQDGGHFFFQDSCQSLSEKLADDCKCCLNMLVNDTSMKIGTHIL